MGVEYKGYEEKIHDIKLNLRLHLFFVCFFLLKVSRSMIFFVDVVWSGRFSIVQRDAPIDSR